MAESIEFVAGRSELKCLIGPSVLNADLSQLYDSSKALLDAGADYLHLDVMDGHFVPNLTFGAPVVQCLRQKLPTTYFEAHMMVSRPEQWIEPMSNAAVDLYTFHVEASHDIPYTCRKVRESGMKVGLAIKPDTDIEAITDYIDLADTVLIMTVEPGFGGQSFMDGVLPKVAWLREVYPLLNIEVDGGVGPNTIHRCAKAGANMIVSGTAVIKAKDPKAVISELRSAVQEYMK